MNFIFWTIVFIYNLEWCQDFKVDEDDGDAIY